MPRLSDYLAAEGSAPGSAQGSQQQQQGGAGGGGGDGLAARATPDLPLQQPLEPWQQEAHQQGQQQQQEQLDEQRGLSSAAAGSGSSGPAPPRPALDPQHEAAAARLQAEYAKRVREHGPRVFRWPDGSLRPERPPPNPHAVANRRLWAPLVQHCRQGGGDRVPSSGSGGVSLRHGLGVDHGQHAAYLGSIGLEPETRADGSWVGEAAGLPAPLEDPEHCFNTFYKQGAEAVFKHKLGRLL